MRDAEGRVLYHYVLVDYLCKRIGGELCASGDAIEAGWFTPEEVARLALPEDTAEVIKLAFQSV
jgi:hypothetical protein